VKGHKNEIRHRPAIVLLCVVGAIDLLVLPFLVAGHHEYPGKPPTAAIVSVAVIGLITLASAVGLAQGWRWSRTAALACRVLDSISWILGLAAHPNALLTAIAAVALILSIVTILLLVGLNPREHRHNEAPLPSPAAAAHPGRQR
jgi:O-antigen/teichoic acid export membrane protein